MRKKLYICSINLSEMVAVTTNLPGRKPVDSGPLDAMITRTNRSEEKARHDINQKTRAKNQNLDC